MSWLNWAVGKAVDLGVKKGVDDFLSSERFAEIVGNAVRDHPMMRFIQAAKFEMMRVDRTLSPRRAWDIANGVLHDFLRDENIKFGDPRFDWNEDAAVALIREMEIDHWETAP